jgi:light-regulated signal transduction histidine kinase (bacteriophytochrome)
VSTHIQSSFLFHSQTHTCTHAHCARFKDDLAGEVMYENLRPGTITSSYAGMRFPSGDIPLPARQLFMRNALRVIHDVNGQEVRLLGTTLPSGAQLDLSMSTLRAVSKVRVHSVLLVVFKRVGDSCLLFMK